MKENSFSINISGMTCINCSNAIEKVTKKMDGVDNVQVSFASSKGTFTYNENITNKNKIVEKIKKLGFGVSENLEELEKQKKVELKTLKKDFFIALIFSLAVIFLDKFTLLNLSLNGLTMLLLASVVQFYCGKRFYTHGFSAIKNKNYDMNVLVALGTSAAYFYSAFVVIFPSLFPEHLRYLYFNGSVMIITFILLGKMLEENSKAKATNFLKKLMDLSPKKALLFKDNTEKEIEAASLQIDDIVIVKSGEAISADGVIIEGEADIDTSMITGEAMPIFKTKGDEVTAGTINKTGFLKIKVLKTATNSMLSHIVSLVSDAQNQKMKIGRIADKVSNIFVPSVIIISAISFILWLFFSENFLSAFLASISVLIVSCPCALGLATPIAIVSGVSKGASEGILIKNPEILEMIKNIKYAIFDKTGTLTEGKISVKKSTIENKEHLKLIKALELKSEHPISKALVSFIDIIASAQVEELEIIPGQGVRGKVDGKKVIVGNAKLLERENIALLQTSLEFIKTSLEDGLGVVMAAIENENIGCFSLEDSIKKDAKNMIDEIKNLGIKPIMLTGDNTQTALKVAENLGIDEVYAEVLPHEKFEVIQKLQEEGKVLFVGDGINDSPSIKKADVGIALSSGSDIAKEAGDILLINNKLTSITKAIKLSKKTLNTIKQNLFWAFIYNVIGIPLAAGALYPFFGLMLTPMYAGMAMSFSSVAVVLNSLRLKISKI